jgi:hypothetical protein
LVVAAVMVVVAAVVGGVVVGGVVAGIVIVSIVVIAVVVLVVVSTTWWPSEHLDRGRSGQTWYLGYCKSIYGHVGVFTINGKGAKSICEILRKLRTRVCITVLRYEQIVGHVVGHLTAGHCIDI